MTKVQDFCVISHTTTTVGDNHAGNNKTGRTFPFGVSDILRSDWAILHFEVKHLTVATQDPEIWMNDKRIGHISRMAMPSKGKDGEANFWFHQSLVFPASTVQTGGNLLTVRCAKWAGSKPGDLYDDFSIRNIVMFYHTEIDARTMSAGRTGEQRNGTRERC